jgi:hypothetical protein
MACISVVRRVIGRLLQLNITRLVQRKLENKDRNVSLSPPSVTNKIDNIVSKNAEVA